MNKYRCGEIMNKCPRCAAEIGLSDKVCPKCGLKVSKMQDYLKSQSVEQVEVQVNEEPKISKEELKAQKKAEKQAKKLKKKQEKKERRIRESKSDTDFSKMAINSEDNEEIKDMPTDDSYKSKKERRKYKERTPQFELDENGEFNIDTSDVELVGEKTGKIIDEQYSKSYSVKKARGDYRPPKIKWWELYKLADRSFARQKIKKEVNKAAIKKPDFIKKHKLLLLAIFLGWLGIHNFYAKNYKKGVVSIATFAILVITFYVPFFAPIKLSIGGCAGFINIFIWISDIVSIISNKYKYRIQKEAFIFGMNVETRAKLGERYIDLELYKKPWWVRFKVWCQRKKEDFEEYKKERRQNKIEREKRKLAEEEKRKQMNENIDKFVSNENQENDEKSKDIDFSKIVDSETLKDINTFEKNENSSDDDDNSKPKKQVDNKAKVKKSFKSKNKKKWYE